MKCWSISSGRIEEAQPELDEPGDHATAARAEAASLAEQANLLDGLAVPRDVDEMAAKAKAVDMELGEREAAAEAAALALEKSEAAYDPTVDRSSLEVAVPRPRGQGQGGRSPPER